MEPEGSLSYSQEPATCPYPEPDQSSAYPPSHFRKVNSNIIIPSTPGFSSSLLAPGFPTKTRYVLTAYILDMYSECFNSGFLLKFFLPLCFAYETRLLHFDYRTVEYTFRCNIDKFNCT
jgi:hypothetical protein